MPLERQCVVDRIRSAWRCPGPLLLLLLLIVSGCSRVTLLRPDTSRRGYERVAPEVDIHKSGQDERFEALERMQLAQLRLREGRFAEAETLARASLKDDGRSVDAMILLAVALEGQGKSEAAGTLYRRAAEAAPARGDALNNYGAWLCRRGRAAESLAWFERALAAPGYATPDAALANSGACALEAGQTERARRDLGEAIRRAPTNAIALGAMAELELAAGNAFAARAFSERRLSAAPADVRSLQIASQIEQKLGDSDAAARYVQRMKKEFPDAEDSSRGKIEGP